MCLHVHVRGRLFYIEVVGLFCRKMFSQMHVHSFLQCMQLATRAVTKQTYDICKKYSVLLYSSYM